jgi:hypothetical protein
MDLCLSKTLFSPYDVHRVENHHGRNILVGSCRAGSSTLIQFACGQRDIVLKETAGNQTNESNGVHWYFRERYSFGFSGSPQVDLNHADDVQGEDRTSWHLDGNGGYRFASKLYLNYDSESDIVFEKVLYTSEYSDESGLKKRVR